MYTCERVLGAALLSAVLCTAAQAATEGPGLGEPMTEEQLLALPASVLPDGAGLPAGGGDAVAGARVYRDHCAACHGLEGAGGGNDVLVGGQGTLTGERPLKTVGSFWPYATTIFDYVSKAMPYPSPGSLSNDQVYAVTAYLLHRNGIIAERQIMNATTLPAVVMPNRDGFVDTLQEPPRERRDSTVGGRR